MRRATHMEWAVVIDGSRHRWYFLWAYSPIRDSETRPQRLHVHCPVIRIVVVFRACRFDCIAPTRVASKSSMASWQRDRRDARASGALLSSFDLERFQFFKQGIRRYQTSPALCTPATRSLPIGCIACVPKFPDSYLPLSGIGLLNDCDWMIPFAANAAATLQRRLHLRLPMLLNGPPPRQPHKITIPVGICTRI